MTNLNNTIPHKKINITIRFYEELNDFLHDYQKKKDIIQMLDGNLSLKTIIESFGVPSKDIDLILVNGISRNLDCTVCDGDYISVYPMFERYNIKTLTKLRGKPLRETKFILDTHLGKLARHLRLLGFDTDYLPNRDHLTLCEASKDQGRILLTCNRQLLKLFDIEKGMSIHNREPFLQVVEVLDRLDLWDDITPFSRCTICNGPIEDIKGDHEDFALLFNNLPPKVQSWKKEIYKCSVCGKVYWKGSHYDKLVLLVEKIMNEKNKS